MTCIMAAGQQKKRLRSSNIHELYKGKRKKRLDSSDSILNLRCHIDLEWDDMQRKVVAKKEQVGLSWTDIAPFLDSVTLPHTGVADVVSVPNEIFSLYNLIDVLSYEVWATCLSESERKLLTHFLPCVKGAEQVVHSLLKGDNHHFGNPYLKWQGDWSTSLCAGNFHPDIVLQMEQQCHLNKRAYYCNINNYHSGIHEALKTWKERWLNCEDPEKFWSGGSSNHKQGSLAISGEEVNFFATSKRESPNKVCMNVPDTDKYMSYIKISRRQHQLVTNISHSGEGIQSKILGRLLGDLKCFHVHPYKTFVEEERKRLHEHWFQIVNKDLPASFSAAKDRKMRREQLRNSLEHDLTEKVQSLSYKEEKTKTIDIHSSRIHESFECSQEFESYNDSRNQFALHSDDEEKVPPEENFTCQDKLERIPSLHGDQKPSPIIVNQEAEETLQLKDDNNYTPLSNYVDKNSPINCILEPQSSLASAKNIWQTASISDSCYRTADNQGYKSANGLSLGQPPPLTVDQADNMIDLEGEINGTADGEAIPSTFSVDSRTALFSTINRSEILPTFRAEPRLLSYPQEMNGIKQPGLHFLMANDGLAESTLLSTQLQQTQQLMEQRESREKEVFMHQALSKKLFSTSYPDEGFPLVERQNITAVQSSANVGNLGYSWFPDDLAYNSWAIESPSSGHRLVDGGSTDGSLYSVLSNKLLASSPFDGSSSEQFIQVGNFVDGPNPNAQNIYGYPHQLDKTSSSLEASAAPFNNGSWMNFPQQNLGLQSQLGRPYHRSWKQ